MSLTAIIALIQSVGGFHLLFSLLSALLPQASKDKPLWYIVRSLIDWAALNIGNAENLPKANVGKAASSEKVLEKVLCTPLEGATSTTSDKVQPVVATGDAAVVDKQAGDGSDVPKFPN